MLARKDLFDDEEGVSEVVGAILTLSITVILFTSVFAGIQELEPPEEETYVDFNSNYEHNGDTDYINISHEGGDWLRTNNLNFIILIDDVSERYRIEDSNVTLTGDDGSSWSIGEEVLIEDNLSLDSDSYLELLIQDEDNNKVIYSSVLLEDGLDLIDIRDPYIDYGDEWKDYAVPGQKITINAEVISPIYKSKDEFDPGDLNVNVSIHENGVLRDLNENPINASEKIPMNHVFEEEFNLTLKVDKGANHNSYSIRITAEGGGLESSPAYTTLNVGKEAAKRYQPDLTIGRIDYNPGSPTHGDEFTVEAEIYNRGAVNYTADWNLTDNGDMEYSETSKFDRGPAPTYLTARYDIEGVGYHELILTLNTTLEDPNGNEVEDSEPKNNQKNITLYVDPNILIVQDLTVKNKEETGLMFNSLSGLNLDYALYERNSEDDYPNRTELNEYSICIWLTGSKVVSSTEPGPLPEDAQDELIDFIDKDEGKLWLVGSNLDTIPFKSGLDDKLGMDTAQLHKTDISGELVNPEDDENGTYGRFEYPVYPASKAHELMSLEPGVENNDTLEDPAGNVVGVGYEPDTRQRTAVNSFKFGSISDPAARANMAQHVIKWLANITIRSGVDVAVSSQRIDNTAPMYQDQVNITATLRNNGPTDLNVTVRCLRDRGEEILEPVADDPWVRIPKNGGTAEVNFTWMANVLGEHEFLVVADYFNEIEETNLDNNDITYKNLDITEDETKVIVQYSTLIVDADLSEEENNENTTKQVIDSFERLGQEEGKNYDYHHVGWGNTQPEDGPSVDKMADYNAIYWVTGERTIMVLTNNDINNLLDYFNHDSGSNVMFVGENILSYLEVEWNNGNANAGKLLENLGVDPGSIQKNSISSSRLIGKEVSDLGHGLEYEITASGLDGFTATSSLAGSEFLFKDEKGRYLASVYDDGRSTKNVYLGISPADIDGPVVDDSTLNNWPAGDVNTTAESAREEIIYTSLWYFGLKKEESEFRVSELDVEFSSSHPQTSRMYKVTVDIENIGYDGESVMVRLKEGDYHVGSNSIFVGSSRRTSNDGSTYFEIEANSTTAEFSWEPVEGGDRPIRVKVDPLGLVKEIGGKDGEIMEFHNHATLTKPVYYFWDDMENGTGKWNHDSTLMNIDGSSALNFIGREGLDSDVKEDWDWSKSGTTDVDGNTHHGKEEGVYPTTHEDVNQFTDNASYSPPRSYWMGEGPGDPKKEGKRRPIDFVLVFDRTMAKQAIDDAQDAAKAIVDETRKGDRISIFSFGKGTTTERHISLNEDKAWTNTSSDKSTIKGVINSLDQASQQKAFFDTTSYAVYDLDRYGRDKAVKGIISLTNGISSQDGSDGPEYKYAPGGGVGEEPDEQGVYNWYDDRDGDGDHGLLGIPYNILTISINNEAESRQHWVSKTSTGNFSYGVLENDTSKLKNIFLTYFQMLQGSTRGELKSVPDPNPRVGLDKEGPETDKLDSAKTQDTLLGGSNAINKTEFFVYADAFTTQDPSFVPGYEGYDSFGFVYDNQLMYSKNPRIHITGDPGETISNTVDPKETLNELNGTYQITDAYVNFLLYTKESGTNSASLGLKVNGNTVFSGMTETTGKGNDYGAYHGRSIFNEITGREEFTFEFENDGTGAELWLDDISFTYEIDYSQEDKEYAENIGTNRTYRYFTTPSVDLGSIEGLRSADLEFRHKYKMTGGTTGGFIYLWGKDSGSWDWEQDNRLYVEPDQSYTGNLNIERVEEQSDSGGPNLTHADDGLRDTNGDLPYWVFNGRSADRTFDWSYASVDITRNEQFLENHDEIRVVFMMAQLGGITRDDGWEANRGWYLDNVRFKVSSEWSSDGPSYWNLTSESDLDEMGITNYYGSPGDYMDHTRGTGDGHYWIFTTENGGKDKLPGGIDSSLYTQPIYLGNSENPRLTAHIKFNIEESAGLPPDGLRVEVSEDNGRTWDSLTYGVRTAWGASGDPGDYSGETEDGSSYGWVNSSTLQRLNADLSGWIGERIIIRFRVFTNNSDSFDDQNLPRAIFIDDVMVSEGEMSFTSSSNTVNHEEDRSLKNNDKDIVTNKDSSREINDPGFLENPEPRTDSSSTQPIAAPLKMFKATKDHLEVIPGRMQIFS
ncbi:MAG: type IV pilin [Candidatus Thermoplasmatota archaeon]|nr:type IV pilin [Candidatus Thermoplasmatota archaeon]